MALLLQEMCTKQRTFLISSERIPLCMSKGLVGNNNFDFQTSPQIFGSHYEKCSGAQSNIISGVQQNNSLKSSIKCLISAMTSPKSCKSSALRPSMSARQIQNLTAGKIVFLLIILFAAFIHSCSDDHCPSPVSCLLSLKFPTGCEGSEGVMR